MSPAAPVPAISVPAISVIVPHFNQPEVLAGLLEALAAQTFRDFEIIVADNGSKAPLPATITDYPGLRTLVEATPGPGPARSAGAAIAQAPILAFTDCDCRPDPGWLAAIAAHFADDAAAPAMAGDVRIAFETPARPTGLEAYEAIFGYRQYLYVARDGYGATCNFAVRADVFARVGPFAGLEVAEDRDWGQRATAMGIAHAYVPAAVIRTPARESFAELARKWDRHIGHDFAEGPGRIKGGRIKWGLRALALLVSPLAELPLVAKNDRVQGLGAKVRAVIVLARIRIYRSLQMVKLLLGGDAAGMRAGWRDTGDRGSGERP